MITQDPFIGQVVGGRYEVIARIGRGAMGAIYEVRHTRLKRSFALKRLMPHLADDKEALERFQQEADVVAGLRHPNVVEIVDWETLADGTPCIVMELLRGENLEQRIRRAGTLSWTELFSIADQVLAALVVAHRAGIVHRDLKPQNIYVARDDSGEERVKLLDFGISKVQGVSQTSAGAVIGTPAYMAPEQADSRNEDISPATDLWAIGAILYELATGAQPFVGASASAILYKVCYGTADPVAVHRPDAPAGFGALVERLLVRLVKERLGDADELRRELKAVANRAPVEPTTATIVPLPPDRTVVSLPPAGHDVTSTTLSRSAGESVEVVLPPTRRERRWMPWAAIVAVVLVGVIIATRPASRPSPPTRVQTAAAPPAPVMTPVVTPTVVPKPTAPVPELPSPRPPIKPAVKVAVQSVARPLRKVVKKAVAHPAGTKPAQMHAIDPFE